MHKILRSIRYSIILFPFVLTFMNIPTVEAEIVQTMLNDTTSESINSHARNERLLYNTAPEPVHQWIAYQSFLNIQNNLSNIPNAFALVNELKYYLKTDDSYYTDNFSPPTGWGHSLDPTSFSKDYLGNTTNKPDCTSAPCDTSLIEGAWEEDHTYYYNESDSKPYAAYCSHFWQPDEGYNAGLNGICFYAEIVPEEKIERIVFLWHQSDSSLKIAQDNFKKAIDNYVEDKNVAYYWLGRTAHLLMDLSVPEHTNLDYHILDTNDYFFI